MEINPLGRPVKWTRDVYPIRDRAAHSRTETWSRTDIEDLFGIRRASAQILMKAIGNVQSVGGAHFVDRICLLNFLEGIITADSVDEALRLKVMAAEPVPRSKTLRTSLPSGLRKATLPDLPKNVTLAAGRIEILADTAVGMVEALSALAVVMQNDLDRWCEVIEPPVTPPAVDDADLLTLFAALRRNA